MWDSLGDQINVWMQIVCWRMMEHFHFGKMLMSVYFPFPLFTTPFILCLFLLPFLATQFTPAFSDFILLHAIGLKFNC